MPIASIFAPHYCCSCGRIGAILCESCKYNIIEEPFGACIACNKPTSDIENLCRTCQQSYSRAWCVGVREGALKELINRYKFERARAASQPLADLLDATLPALPQDMIVVSVPTIAPHIRQRGYDHMARIARHLAKQRGLVCAPLVRRTSKTVQHGATRATRLKQAKNAFTVPFDCSGKHILLIDDVCTTGATLEYAARSLREKGAADVWVAVISVQLLEK